jgi:hypothetical protein
MPTTFITVENMPAVLAQATERIDRLEAESPRPGTSKSRSRRQAGNAA